MKHQYKKTLCLMLSLGLGILASCAKEEERPTSDSTASTHKSNSKEEFQQHNIALSVGIDEEELRLIAGVYKQREGRDASEQYPSFRLYNTPETFRGSRATNVALPESIKRFFPGRSTYGEITQDDLDKAPYNMGATFVGGNRHSGSVIVYNPSIGAGSASASQVTLQARHIDGRDVLTYRGPVDFNKGVDVFNQGSSNDWHAMVFIGARKEGRPAANSLPADLDPNQVMWRVYIGTRLGDKSWNEEHAPEVTDSSFELTTTNSYHGSDLPNFVGLPLASNWSKLKIEGGASGSNDPDKDERTDMKLKMQGALVQYDVVVNVSDQLDIRRWGLISNSLDVQGSYMITPETVQQAFDTKDGEAFGVPGWRAEKPNYTANENSPAAFFLYKRNGSDPARIGDAAYSFPWDLPALHTPHATGQSKAPAIGQGASEVVIGQALYAYRRYFPEGLPATGNGTYNPERLLTDNGANKNSLPAYGGTVVSGTSRSPRADNQNFQRYIFWGMPRKERPAQAATYLFADVHNGRFLYQSPTASNNLNGEELQAMRQENYAVQKGLVLHQTNANFRSGRISHIQTTIESDLMISEIAQEVRGNRNFVAVEFINPSWQTIDIRNYALVRLIPKTSGNTTSYEYYIANGQTTSNIKEATLLPLSLLDGSTTTANEAIKNFSAWSANAGSTTFERRNYITHNSPSLNFQQIAILGSYNLYTAHPFVHGGRESGRLSSYSVARKVTTTSHPVLNLTSEEQPAFALIRFYDNGRGYRIIDATAPIPTSNTYSEGVSEPYPLNNSTSPYLQTWEKIRGKSYTIQRKPGVNFPSIFPYRTDLNFNDLWTADILTDLQDGTESSIASMGYRSNEERKLDGTAGQPKLPANRNSTYRPIERNGNYKNYTRTPAHDYNWWSTRYSQNIPSQTRY